MKTKKIVAYVVAALFFWMGFSNAVRGVLFYAKAKSSQNWTATSGTIISSDIKKEIIKPGRSKLGGGGGSYPVYTPWIHYQYRAGESVHVAERISFGSASIRRTERSEAEAIRAGYPKDKVVTVYYNPSNPEEAVIHPGISDLKFVQIGFGILMTVVGLWVAFLNYKGKIR